MRLKWVLVLTGLYVLADYLQDGIIDGTLWGHHIPILLLAWDKYTIVLPWTQAKNQNGELDLRATMKKAKRKLKDRHHKHQG